jgi:hypothetical protein
MAHLTRIVAEQLAGRNIDVALGARTLLVGPEESGKTSTINAIRLGCHYGIPEIGDDHAPGQLLQLVSGLRASVTVCLDSGFVATSVLKRSKAEGVTRGNWEIRCSPGPASSRNEDHLPLLRNAVGVRPVSMDVSAWLDVDGRKLRGELLRLVGQVAKVTREAVVAAIREKMPDVSSLGFVMPKETDPLVALEKLALEVDKARIDAERERREAAAKAKVSVPELPDAARGDALNQQLQAAVATLGELQISLGQLQERARVQADARLDRGLLAATIRTTDLQMQQLSAQLEALPAAPIDMSAPSAESLQSAANAVEQARQRLATAKEGLSRTCAQEDAAAARRLARERLAETVAADRWLVDDLQGQLAAVDGHAVDLPSAPDGADLAEAQKQLQAAEEELRKATGARSLLVANQGRAAAVRAQRVQLVDEIERLKRAGVDENSATETELADRVALNRGRLENLGLAGMRQRQDELTAAIDALKAQIEDRRSTLSERQGALRALEGFAEALETGSCPIIGLACDRLGAETMRLAGAREAVTKQLAALEEQVRTRLAREEELRQLRVEGRRLADLEHSLKIQIDGDERALAAAVSERAQQRSRAEGELTAKRDQLAQLPIDDGAPESDAGLAQVTAATERRDTLALTCVEAGDCYRAAMLAYADAEQARAAHLSTAAQLAGRLSAARQALADHEAIDLPEPEATDEEPVTFAEVDAARVAFEQAAAALVTLRDQEREAAAHNRSVGELRAQLAAKTAELRQSHASTTAAQAERRARLAALPPEAAIEIAAVEAAVAQAVVAEASARQEHDAHQDEIRRTKDAIAARNEAVRSAEGWKLRHTQVKQLLAVIHEVQQEILTSTLEPVISRVVPYVPQRVRRFEIDLSAGGCEMGFRQGSAFVPWRAVAESLRIAWLFALAAAVADLERQPTRIGLLDGLYRVAPGRQPEVLDCLARMQADGLVDQLVITAHELPEGWSSEGWTVVHLSRAENLDTEQEPAAELVEETEPEELAL